MHIDQLETFLDLIQTRSFNRSAERLGVTQSTVSGRIAALEAALGTRLFTRSRAGTDLTTEGLKFEAHARALRHGWTEAQRAVRPSGTAALSLRIGIQNDLAAGHIGDWVAEFRSKLPDCAFYLEPDYSAQMCTDLAQGALDFAVIFTPRALPDLHFASVGEVRYRLVSSDGDSRESLTAARYIRGNYAPAFEQTQRQLFPDLATAPLAAGQNAAVAGLLTSLGGAAFVLEETAAQLIAQHGFRAVTDVPAITQPVYAAMHLRHRPAPLHRRLTRIVQRQLAGR
ncbi:LysR family transcriptional regulator [Rhodobacter ferrooxidans]|uniref:Transcriptional regulator, LysR family n=1 Tax=Rhodobacter ferrooxidans TaxID=371731 RepID=C8S0U7_9RHOB|nr:LysR family transcriptional regulator [Rhodobacter sp. SW2]EEW25388.1 transcriptional regulator, LysR family [Rhodobacter sp. SW2]